jgi:hypothetical protein
VQLSPSTDAGCPIPRSFFARWGIALLVPSALDPPGPGLGEGTEPIQSERSVSERAAR